MGWLDGWNQSQNEAYQNLDPSLKAYLEKETPSSDAQSPKQAQSQDTAKKATQNGNGQQLPITERNLSPSGEEAVASQSLYPDGRFAHLWKTYRPIDVVEAEAKSDQEKLQDVIDAYKDRRHRIGQAALENCAEEQMKVTDCFNNGKLSDKWTMCSNQKKTFNRCYEMQTRFLKALGYLSLEERDPRVHESIQMHADLLYQRLVSREQAVEEARAAGKPIPEFPPLNIPSPLDSSPQQPFAAAALDSTPQAATPQATSSRDAENVVSKVFAPVSELPPLKPESEAKLKPSTALALRERMRNMTPDERDAEERATVANVDSALEAHGELQIHLQRISEARQKRREEGNATLMDRFAGIFGK